jgi:hypothetical protein
LGERTLKGFNNCDAISQPFQGCYVDASSFTQGVTLAELSNAFGVEDQESFA